MHAFLSLTNTSHSQQEPIDDNPGWVCAVTWPLLNTTNTQAFNYVPDGNGPSDMMVIPTRAIDIPKVLPGGMIDP
jgi:hypothetical protein